jgi:hypothetical protein
MEFGFVSNGDFEYPLRISTYGRFTYGHVVESTKQIMFLMFDSKIIVGVDDDCVNLIKYGDMILLRNNEERSIDIYTSIGELIRIRSPRYVEFNSEYISWIEDENLYLGLISDLIECQSFDHPDFRKQILSSDMDEWVLIGISNANIINLYRELPLLVERSPLNNNFIKDGKIFDITTGIFINTGYEIMKDSPMGRYAITNEGIIKVERTINMMVGPILRGIQSVISTDIIIPFKDWDGKNTYKCFIEWIMEDIALLNYPDHEKEHPAHLINLSNLRTKDISDLYQDPPSKIEAGFVFEIDGSLKFIPERSTMRAARELLSPHTKTNLNTLGLVKEIPTSVTDRIGMYV